MGSNDVISLGLALVVVAGAMSLRSRAAGNTNRMIGWWIGLLHGLLVVLTVRAATLAHDFPFRVAMLTFAAYGVGMAFSEAVVMLKADKLSER